MHLINTPYNVHTPLDNCYLYKMYTFLNNTNTAIYTFTPYCIQRNTH